MNLDFQHFTPSSKTVCLLRDNVLQFENPGAGFWVSVAPHPQARPSYCDENVALAIRDSGGEAVHVWDVTETGNFVEFEAHIIWKRRPLTAGGRARRAGIDNNVIQTGLGLDRRYLG